MEKVLVVPSKGICQSLVFVYRLSIVPCARYLRLHIGAVFFQRGFGFSALKCLSMECRIL